ncbi:hypothetical protein Molly5_79 [Maribacter phage Molly_5]|uniref:Uncharacterized protein n=2 Tax=Mollyvirus TaxID=2948826 RepID=A0A8E4UY34_9CAUD|nr:hypothetical protein M1M29_gp079 [Maribacter phage Molly_1]YP_010357326.1 hypothetical protein M1M30_gp077 [Maribacter phage Colly_1]QQO97765.1 hypothetical protein Molly2_79 [Maribacter phage Molly_2]QQO97965.1 hypothetical protein Molly3_79 [Maribacter phage Molly_3]QQO98165.1 hypothetical protein Molly4_79 [Maribacter phage Molly_4]QQO98365.1 hypothetical protein Molly5_79 [Maribacter phage Molly_5]QQO97363.1 hypothetical protein Colly1_77 [Maribacter phage Colly_1]
MTQLKKLIESSKTTQEILDVLTESNTNLNSLVKQLKASPKVSDVKVGGKPTYREIWFTIGKEDWTLAIDTQLSNDAELQLYSEDGFGADDALKHLNKLGVKIK